VSELQITRATCAREASCAEWQWAVLQDIWRTCDSKEQIPCELIDSGTRLAVSELYAFADIL